LLESDERTGLTIRDSAHFWARLVLERVKSETRMVLAASSPVRRLPG
jgi:hypothetical protein